MTTTYVPVPLTEKQWTQQVTELAKAMGWKCYHTWLSIRSERGFPDLTLCRPGRLVFIELKTDAKTSKTTAKQDEWLAALREAGAEAYVFRPRDWDALVATLQGRAE